MDDAGSQLIGVPELGIGVDDFPVAAEGGMDHLVLVDLAQPHVVALVPGVEDVDGDIGGAHLANNCPVGSIANIYSSVLFGSVPH